MIWVILNALMHPQEWIVNEGMLLCSSENLQEVNLDAVIDLERVILHFIIINTSLLKSWAQT